MSRAFLDRGAAPAWIVDKTLCVGTPLEDDRAAASEKLERSLLIDLGKAVDGDLRLVDADVEVLVLPMQNAKEIPVIASET
ncbi:hypothetical protein [Bradyrhizobium embrapense]|uniref:hypothetical protein n=1 Tax=Bradyrhizobium embrapense TaxID=630921 RepID=UPI000A9AB27F|nr:hypothetical protein [Bradyrhizobium embrapense]